MEVQPTRLNYNLADDEYAERTCQWASQATEYYDEGYPCTIEGVDWSQSCKDHGFWGAVQKVKSRYQLRKAARYQPNPPSRG